MNQSYITGLQMSSNSTYVGFRLCIDLGHVNVTLNPQLDTVLPITNQWAQKEHLEHEIEGVHKAHTGQE